MILGNQCYYYFGSYNIIIIQLCQFPKQNHSGDGGLLLEKMTGQAKSRVHHRVLSLSLCIWCTHVLQFSTIMHIKDLASYNI